MTDEEATVLADFPSGLRALILAEVAASNAIARLRCGHPAPPNGESVMLRAAVTTRARESGDGLLFFERQGSHHSGEFTDDARRYFVLEPPVPYIEPDMDAIRNELSARERASTTSMEHWR